MSWNGENLCPPRINGLGVAAVDGGSHSSENLRRMRLSTTLSLTHSDGYVHYMTGLYEGTPGPRLYPWCDFWDADLGYPVGGNETKGQTYNSIEELFIREFTNGWAVYNRSGAAQTINLPQKTTGAASGLQDTQHTIPDLDSEICLKSTGKVADLNGDGIANILDLVIVANAF